MRYSQPASSGDLAVNAHPGWGKGVLLNGIAALADHTMPSMREPTLESHESPCQLDDASERDLSLT